MAAKKQIYVGASTITSRSAILFQVRLSFSESGEQISDIFYLRRQEIGLKNT